MVQVEPIKKVPVIGIASFGESAPAKVLYAHFGITAEAVVRAMTDRVS
jgi:transketolase